jgi:hypothetical protein
MGMFSSKHAAICLAVATCAGCGGSGVGLDNNGRPIGPGGSDLGPLTADFKSIQDHVFTPICTVCHAGAGAPQGLRLDAVNSYGLLVGIPSTEAPSVLRVVPGDPDNSYVIQKLEGHASVGARMPYGGPYLDTTTIAVIRQWISDGARPPAATLPTGMPTGRNDGAHHLMSLWRGRIEFPQRRFARDDEFPHRVAAPAGLRTAAATRAAGFKTQRSVEG